MSTLSQSTLRRRYYLACNQLGVEKGHFPYQTTPKGDGSAHVEISGGQYHYVVTERGEELERRRTHDADELMYWLLQDVTFDVALKFERQHRVPGQDFRRIFFAKQVELLRGLNPAWAQREADEHARILMENPFEDRAEPKPRATAATQRLRRPRG